MSWKTCASVWAIPVFPMRFRAWVMGKDDKVPAPAGMAMFPQEIARPPREWGERPYHMLRWEEMPRGGHFAALEEPELLAQEVRAFFRQFR